MNDVRKKYSDIEINYRKIPYDRQMDEKLKENGKKKKPQLFREKYFNFFSSSSLAIDRKLKKEF